MIITYLHLGRMYFLNIFISSHGAYTHRLMSIAGLVLVWAYLFQRQVQGNLLRNQRH